LQRFSLGSSARCKSCLHWFKKHAGARRLQIFNQKILVAIDGSETANLALKEAVKLAKEQDATLRLIHIIDESQAFLAFDESPMGDPELIEEVRVAFQTTGEKIMAEAVHVSRELGVKAETTIKRIEGLGPHVAELIEEEASRWPADLIVIGTRGRRGVRRLLLGSVAEGVSRIATKPVLLVRGT
jgi:nucleotide-binding universal stress UspA family protein